MAGYGESAAATNPVMRLLADAPMSRRQILAVGIAVALNALDGFDVLAITFAAPGITRDWGIGPAQLGVALSSGLAGMALGSLVLAPLGDRFGRRPLVLGCLVLMAGGMLLTATSTGLASLCLWRIVTGLGIGGMVAAINAVASEFANERRRDLSVALMTIGYPVGGLLGGFAVAEFVVTHGWRSVFVAGGLATAAFLPLVWLGLPEFARISRPQGHARGARKDRHDPEAHGPSTARRRRRACPCASSRRQRRGTAWPALPPPDFAAGRRLFPAHHDILFLLRVAAHADERSRP